jgi:hypothetical protein
MGDFDVVASELESIAKHLRRAGEVELVRSLQTAMTRAVTSVKDDIRRNLKPALPDRYAETLGADLTIRVNSFSGADPHVSISGSPRAKQRKLRKLDDGFLAHPLFGDREHWRTNTPENTKGMRAKFFSGPAEAAAPRVRQAVINALDDVTARAVSKGA